MRVTEIDGAVTESSVVAPFLLSSSLKGREDVLTLVDLVTLSIPSAVVSSVPKLDDPAPSGEYGFDEAEEWPESFVFEDTPPPEPDCPKWFLNFSPGTIGVRAYDPARSAEAVKRATEKAFRRETLVEVRLDYETGELIDIWEKSATPPAEIKEWSLGSRMNMTKAIADLDFTDWDDVDGALAMVTLTLPSDWMAVAPTGRDFKRLVAKLRRRWERNVGKWMNIWKLEFQRRGAPHMHLLSKVPVSVVGEPFSEWLSRNWAEVCDADKTAPESGKPSEYEKHLRAGTGLDFSKRGDDPGSIAMYFLGYTSKSDKDKEYQHLVPDEWSKPGCGPGRFWGYAGLRRALAEVEVDEKTWADLCRQLRKLDKARRWKRKVGRERRVALRLGLPEVRSVDVAAEKRRNRSLGAGGSSYGGWVMSKTSLGTVERLLDYVKMRAAA